MSRETFPRQPDPSTEVPRPTLFVKTLGRFEALCHGKPIRWRGGGAGRHQLRRQFSCLVVYRDRLVADWRLLEVAGRRGNDTVRSKYVIYGLCQLLRRHGLSQVLQRSETGLMLQSGACWKTDTDVLQDYYDQAQDRLQAGDRSGAMTLLQAVFNDPTIALGQEYMVELCRCLPHDTYLHDQVEYWRNIQRDAIRLLVEQLLDDPPRDRDARHRPHKIIRLALDLEGRNEDDLNLAARAAEYAGLHRLAAWYRRQVAGDG